MILAKTSYGQVQVGRQVIGSSGGSSTSGSMVISSTVGETIITTQVTNNLILTQGFQQTFNRGDSIVTANVINESCVGASNGSIAIENVIGCAAPYRLSVKSVNDTSTVLSPNTLATGEYEVKVTGNSGCFYFITLFVGLDSDEDCQLKFYSGITPNGDGQNDVWIIDNIEQFPDNEVSIYNRLGEEVWSGSGYNNRDISWNGEGNGRGRPLVSATYFYIVKINGNIYKGWVELTR